MSYQFSNTTSLSDETYLEAFIESISASFPNEMRRNLEHLRDLDTTTHQRIEDWRDSQDACLQAVEESLVKFFGMDTNANEDYDNDDNENDDDNDNDNDNNDANGKKKMGEDNNIIIMTTSTPTNPKTAQQKDDEKEVVIAISDGKRGSKRKKQSQSDQQLQQRSSEKKVACTQCRARKVKCDGRQTFCLHRQLFNKSSPTLEGGEKQNNIAFEGKSNSNQSSSQNLVDLDKGKPTIIASPRNPSSSSAIRPPPTRYHVQRPTPPSNDEIEAALHTHYPDCPSHLRAIKSLYHDLQQLSDEKIKTAQQLKAMIGMVLGRLDRDFEKFEKELGIDPAFHKSSYSTILEGSSSSSSSSTSIHGGIVDLGLLPPLGGRGILNHTNFHPALGAPTTTTTTTTTTTGAYGASVATNPRLDSLITTSSSSSFIASVTASASMVQPMTTSSMQQAQQRQQQKQQQMMMSISQNNFMRGNTTTSSLPPSNSIQTMNLAAIKVTPESSDWILAKIISYDKSTKIYTLSDEDEHSHQIIYKISDKQVIPLKGNMERNNKWTRGEDVYAVYPDTTSFYPATISSSSSSTTAPHGYVMVHFKDDWDANGVTHEKAVLVAHVMKVPSR